MVCRPTIGEVEIFPVYRKTALDNNAFKFIDSRYEKKVAGYLFGF